MLRSWTSVPVAVLIFAVTGCDSGPHSAAGFRLPPSGDAERGKAAFVARQCYNCHSVEGVDLPSASLLPKAVALGGEFSHQVTDGYLVTSIMYPSHVVAGHAKSQSPAGLRMPDYADDMTVRELTDIVAFLQSKYTIQRAPKYPASL